MLAFLVAVLLSSVRMFGLNLLPILSAAFFISFLSLLLRWISICLSRYLSVFIGSLCQSLCQHQRFVSLSILPFL